MNENLENVNYRKDNNEYKYETYNKEDFLELRKLFDQIIRIYKKSNEKSMFEYINSIIPTRNLEKEIIKRDKKGNKKNSKVKDGVYLSIIEGKNDYDSQYVSKDVCILIIKNQIAKIIPLFPSQDSNYSSTLIKRRNKKIKNEVLVKISNKNAKELICIIDVIRNSIVNVVYITEENTINEIRSPSHKLYTMIQDIKNDQNSELILFVEKEEKNEETESIRVNCIESVCIELLKEGKQKSKNVRDLLRRVISLYIPFEVFVKFISINNEYLYE